MRSAELIFLHHCAVSAGRLGTDQSQAIARRLGRLLALAESLAGPPPPGSALSALKLATGRTQRATKHAASNSITKRPILAATTYFFSLFTRTRASLPLLAFSRLSSARRICCSLNDRCAIPSNVDCCDSRRAGLPTWPSRDVRIAPILFTSTCTTLAWCSIRLLHLF